MIKEEIREAIFLLRYFEICDIVKSAIDSGIEPLEILGELRAGLTAVGNKYQSGDFFLSQLYVAAETMKKAMEVLQPILSEGIVETSKGKIVIGSIEGDIHDFGKIIVSSLLSAAGFSVIDLGVDVPANRFVEEAERLGSHVIGISALLSTTQPSCKEVIAELKKRGIRENYKVIMGGTGVNPEIAVTRYGVDAAVNDGVEGVKIISGWMEIEEP